jgi:hypothetical protein
MTQRRISISVPPWSAIGILASKHQEEQSKTCPLSRTGTADENSKGNARLSGRRPQRGGSN